MNNRTSPGQSRTEREIPNSPTSKIGSSVEGSASRSEKVCLDPKVLPEKVRRKKNRRGKTGDKNRWLR